jgi:hypothetical protein
MLSLMRGEAECVGSWHEGVLHKVEEVTNLL